MGTPYNADFDRQARRDRQRGNRAEDEYLDRATNFDARGAARESAGAMYEDFARELERGIGDIRGGQVGMGRLGTGWGFGDEDEYIGEGRRDLTRSLASRALDAESLNLRNTEGLGNYGQNTTNRYLDVLAGNRDAQMLEDQQKRSKKAGLWGLGGSMLGSLLGPAGATASGMLGDKVAGLFGKGKEDVDRYAGRR